METDVLEKYKALAETIKLLKKNTKNSPSWGYGEHLREVRLRKKRGNKNLSNQAKVMRMK